MFVSDVTSGGNIPLLEKTLAFVEARNKMLATNIANATTPGYRAKQLNVRSFQSALRDASRKRENGGGPLAIEGTKEFHVDDQGLLEVRPSEEPVENALFQDGTNASIERQMSQLAENAMMNQVTVELLKSEFGGIEKAIRGRVV